SDNAQNEEYLTDVVRILSGDNKKEWKITSVQVKDYHEVMAFNNPEELLKIEDYYNRKESRENSCQHFTIKEQISAVRPVEEWLRLFEAFAPDIRRLFTDIYGDNEDIIAERHDAYIQALRKFIRVYGKNSHVVIARSPGRINLMGRHIEHRGGYTNYITINREMLLIAGIREDDVIDIHNIDAKSFRPRHFSIGDEISRLPWDEWLTMINSDTVLDMIRSSHG
ncbi:unnamed protein product, partial [marine sediment metagenome]